ncbi:MAG: alcohol dehydrogenase catalytic domain-containing protein [Bryobacteraceae bacterium]|jgi:alcohol dehydrogenase
MLAVRLEKGLVQVRKQSRPRRPQGFALIRLLEGGICNTDLELQRGYYNFRGTPGHEFVGEVIEADSSDLIGERVVGEINLACGTCEWCAKGLGRHCPRRTVLGIVKHPGAFRELLTLPERNLHRVPRGIPTEHAVFVEPLAAACEILDQVRIPAGARVAVLGDGKLGLLIGQVLKAHGSEVHQYGRHKEKLRIATQAGIDARVARKSPQAEYGWVVDATGSSDGLRQAVMMTKPRGTVVMKSTVHGSVALDSAPVIVNEITLVGSRCGRFEPALRLLRTKQVNVASLISEILPLKNAAIAFRRAATPGVLKVLLQG